MSNGKRLTVDQLPDLDVQFRAIQEQMVKLAREAANKAALAERQRVSKAWLKALRVHSALRKSERLGARSSLINHWRSLRDELQVLAGAERSRLMTKLRRQLPDVYRGVVGVFDKARGGVVRRSYRAHRWRGSCMYNLMLGMGSTLTGRVARAQRYRVWRTIRLPVERRHGKRQEMHHLMAAARQQGFATRALTLRYRGRRGRHRWEPPLRTAILRMVGPDAGWYFFGLALHRGYHCVFIAVDYRNPGDPKFIRMDQYGTKDISADVNGAMLQFNPVAARRRDPTNRDLRGYTSFRYSKLWQLIPPAS